MPWLDLANPISCLPDELQAQLRRVVALRMSPKFLVGVCYAQLLLIVLGLLQQLNTTFCVIDVPPAGTEGISVDCPTCHARRLTITALFIQLCGLGVIGCGFLAVQWRDQRLLYVYGSLMLFFAMVVGLTAVLVNLQLPIVEAAVAAVDPAADMTCFTLAHEMMESVSHQATLSTVGCLVDFAGAIFAIRSRELFSYEEIASQHAEVSNAQAL